MKYTRMVYSDFSSNSREHTTLFELWCLIGGTVCAIFIAFDAGQSFSGTPRVEVILSLMLPALFFAVHYLLDQSRWRKAVLSSVILISGLNILYQLFWPALPHIALPFSNILLAVFCLVSWVLIPSKNESHLSASLLPEQMKN